MVIVTVQKSQQNFHVVPLSAICSHCYLHSCVVHVNCILSYVSHKFFLYFWPLFTLLFLHSLYFARFPLAYKHSQMLRDSYTFRTKLILYILFTVYICFHCKFIANKLWAHSKMMLTLICTHKIHFANSRRHPHKFNSILLTDVVVSFFYFILCVQCLTIFMCFVRKSQSNWLYFEALKFVNNTWFESARGWNGWEIAIYWN